MFTLRVGRVSYNFRNPGIYIEIRARIPGFVGFPSYKRLFCFLLRPTKPKRSSIRRIHPYLSQNQSQIQIQIDS